MCYCTKVSFTNECSCTYSSFEYNHSLDIAHMDSNILMIRGFPQAINYWKAKTNKHDLSKMKTINAYAHFTSRAAPAAGHGLVQYISAMW